MNNKIIVKIVSFLLISIALLVGWFTLNKNDQIAVTTKKSMDLSGKKVVFLAVNTDIAAAKLLAQWFNEETGAVVHVKENDYDKMVDEFIKDNHSAEPLVDVVEVWQPTIAKLVNEGAVYDITDLINLNRDAIQIDDFFPKIYDKYSLYRDRRWALPYDVDTQFFYYRVSLLEKYGLQPPKTWNDVVTIAKIITENEKENGIYGYAMMGYPVPIMLVSSYVNRLSAYGGKFIDENGFPSLNTPQAVKALQSLIDIYHYSLPTPSQTDYEVSKDAFLTGRVAMVDQFTNIGVEADNIEFSSIKGDWGMVQMPSSLATKKNVANLNAGFSIAISSKSPNIEAAKEFLLFAVRPDIQKRLALSNTGMDPGRLSVVHSNEFKQMTPQVANATEKSFSGEVFSWPVHPKMLEMMEILTLEITGAFEGKKTAEEAILDTQNRWIELLGSSSKETK